MTLLTEKRLIKHWAKHVNQFITESNNENVFVKLGKTFDKYVKDNDYNYLIGLTHTKYKIKNPNDFFTYAIVKTANEIETCINTDDRKSFRNKAIITISDLIMKDYDTCKELEVIQRTDSDTINFDKDILAKTSIDLYNLSIDKLYDDIDIAIDEYDEVVQYIDNNTNTNKFIYKLAISDIEYTDLEIAVYITNHNL